MTLPRHLLHRIRRTFRRRLMLTDRSTLHAIEEWTGHRPPPPQTPKDPMKLPRLILLLAALAAAVFLAGCQSVVSLDSPNPLDTPETNVMRPASMGRFGPHSEYYNNAVHGE